MKRPDLDISAKGPHGGKREGAGRPRTAVPRCTCGKHTLARALRQRLKCRK